MDASSDAINQSYDTIRAADSDSDGEVGGDVTIKSPQSTIVSINTKNDMQSPASHQVFEDNNLTSPVSNFSMGMTPSSNMSYDDRDELRTPSSALGLDDIAVSIAQHASPSSKNVRLENVRNLYRFYLHMKVPRSSTPVLLDTVTRLEEMESNVDTDFDTLQTLNIHELVFFEQIQSEKYLDVSKVCYKDHSKFHDHTNLFRVEKGINEQDFPVFDCNIELFDAAQMKFVSITEDLDYLWHIENDTFAFYTNIHHHPSKEDADVYLGLKIPFWWWKDHVLLPLMRIRNELNRDCALRDLILVQNPYLPLSQRLHYLYYKYLPCPRVITSPHRMSKSIIEISLYGFSTLLIYLPVSICIILIVILYSLCNLCCFGALERDREECSLEWLARQFGGNTTSGDAHSHNEAYDEVTAGNGNANRMEEGEGVSGQSGDTNTSTNRGSGRSYSRVDLDLEEINEEYTEPMSMQFREGMYMRYIPTHLLLSPHYDCTNPILFLSYCHHPEQVLVTPSPQCPLK